MERRQRRHDGNLTGNRTFAADFETDPDQHDTDYRGISEGLAGAKQGGVYGDINHDDEWVIPPRFSEIRPFQDSLT